MLDGILSLAKDLAQRMQGKAAGASSAEADAAEARQREAEQEGKAEEEEVQAAPFSAAAALPVVDAQEEPQEVAEPAAEAPREAAAQVDPVGRFAQAGDGAQAEGAESATQQDQPAESFALSPVMARRQAVAAQRAQVIEERMAQNRSKRLEQAQTVQKGANQ